MPRTLLIINPNSTTSVTAAIAKVLESHSSNEFKFAYLSGPPPDAPPVVIDRETEQSSMRACWAVIEPIQDQYDGYLVACYADHPLVDLLATKTRKPAVGMFQSSIVRCLLGSEGKFGIITTGTGWEEMLDEGVRRFLGIGKEANAERFAGTLATGLSLEEITSDPELLRKKVVEAVGVLDSRGATAVCLGSIGMCGRTELKHAILSEFPQMLVSDGLVFGIELLKGLVMS